MRCSMDADAAGMKGAPVEGLYAPAVYHPKGNERGTIANPGDGRRSRCARGGRAQEPGRTQSPDLPPRFSTRRTDSMVIVRSTALHMS